jgi:hypothetical protein
VVADAWLGILQTQHGVHAVTWASERSLAVTVKGEQASVDLRAVPAGVQVQVDVQLRTNEVGGPLLTVSHGPEGVQVQIQLSGSEPLKVMIEDTASVAVTVPSGTPGSMRGVIESADAGIGKPHTQSGLRITARGVLDLALVEIDAILEVPDGSSLPHVEISDSIIAIQAGLVDAITFRGLVAIWSCPYVESVSLQGWAVLRIPRLHCGRLRLPDPDAPARLSRQVDLAGGSQIEAGTIDPAGALELDSGETLRVLTHAKDLTLGGNGILALGPEALVSGLSIKPAEVAGRVQGVTRITAAAGATAAGISGRLAFLGIADSRLIGDGDDGFELVNILGDDPSAQVAGAAIERFHVRPGLHGRRLLDALGGASHVAPMLTDMPGLAHRFPQWALFRRANVQEHITELRVQEQYVRSMLALVSSRGAPAGVRTKAAWASYRLRQLTSSSRSERWLLGFYRCFGYGERPVPALALWAFGVAVVCAASLRSRPWGLNWSGLVEVMHMAAFWALPTLGIVNLPELPDGSKATSGTYAVHVLLAIPLLTGLVSLRKYVKRAEEMNGLGA